MLRPQLGFKDSEGLLVKGAGFFRAALSGVKNAQVLSHATYIGVIFIEELTKQL